MFWIIVLNMVGIILSLIIYSYQLFRISPFLWLFVADCPVAAVFFVMWLLGVRNKYFELFARLSLIKYGLWTLVVLLSSWDYFYWDFIIPQLLFHAGMVVEAFFWRSKFVFKHYVPAVLLLLLNDVLDYFLLIHPPINPDLFTETMIFTFSLTFIVPLLFFWFDKKF